MRKLGINCDAFGQNTGADCLPLLKELGFDSIFSGFGGEEQCFQIANIAARVGLDFETIHCPFEKKYFGGTNSIWTDGEEGEQYLNLLKSYVDLCFKTDAKTLIIHLSSGVIPPRINDIGCRHLDSLVDYAVEKNVTLAFENQRRLANLAFVMERYESVPQVGFCWDIGHECCLTTNGMQYMPIFGKDTVALHIHDNHCVYEKDEHLIPFDGIIDFHRFGRQIRESGYQGTLMLEVIPSFNHLYDGLTPKQYFTKAMEAATRLKTIVEGKMND